MRALGLALAAAVLPAVLSAQTLARPGVILGAEYHTVSFGTGSSTKKVSELSIPLGVTLPLSRRVTVDLGTYYVRAERTNDSGAATSISGLTDLVLRSAIQLKPDVAVLTVAVNVPVGQGSLTLAQDSVARAVSSDLIPFQVANFGTGFNVTTGLAFATPVGSWALGLAGSYRYNGSYEPFAGNTITLKPGGEVRLRVGAERLVGQGRVALGLTFSTFSSDEFGSTARKPGSRIIPQLSWSLPMGNNNLSLYAWDLYRNVKENPADTTIAKENTLTAGAILALRVGRNSLRPQVEFRSSMIGPGGLRSNGTMIGLGLRYAMQSGRFSIVPGVRFDTGSRPIGATSVSFTGFSGGVTIRSSF